QTKMCFKYTFLIFFSILALTSSDLDISNIDCTINGTLAKCPTACPETCEFVSRYCSNKCGGPCVCKEGYIIDGDRHICVLKSDCPADLKQTTVNRHYAVNIKYFGSSMLFNFTEYK
ncbi:hypothetical protein KR032_009682, partial [Drosophila birchii]